VRSQVLMIEDPAFAPGSTHTATVSVPVSPAGMSCTAELWLSADGVTKAASSGAVPFTSTGAQQSISLVITMPAMSPSGGYAVYIDIVSDGVLVGSYQAIENVSVGALVDIRVDRISISPTQVTLGQPVTCIMRCTNYGNSAGSRDIVITIANDGASVSQTIRVTLDAGRSSDVDIEQALGADLSAEVGHITVSADGQSATLDVSGSAAITGVVKAADIGLPVQGATVQLFGMSDQYLTDANGRFTIIGLPFASGYLSVSYPQYVTESVPFQGLTNGATKDIGVVNLTPLSAIQFVSVALPAAGTNYHVGDSIFAGFRVKNVSAQAAYVNLALTLSVAGAWGNTVSTQLLLQPGQVSDWYGTPYPLQQIAARLGAQQLTAYVNSVAVGQVGITVGPTPGTITVVNWRTPPQQALVAAGDAGTWVLKITNVSSSYLSWRALIQVQKPSGGVLTEIDTSGNLAPGAHVLVPSGSVYIKYTEAGGWYWTAQTWANGALQTTDHASTNAY